MTVRTLPPFQRFLDSHADDVLRFLVASVGRHDADDAFQETFLSALRAYPRLRPESNLRGWVLTIAHHKAMDVHRGRTRRPQPVAEIDDYADPPGPPGATAAAVAAPVAGARPAADASTDGDHWERVRALPPRQREVLTLRYAADLTHAALDPRVRAGVERGGVE